jgi:hypothetical protein
VNCVAIICFFIDFSAPAVLGYIYLRAKGESGEELYQGLILAHKMLVRKCKIPHEVGGALIMVV